MTEDIPEAPEFIHTYHSENGGVTVSFVSSGAKHVFEFTLFENQAWPETMEQGGETYRIGVADVPEFVTEWLESEGYEVTEG